MPALLATRPPAPPPARVRVRRPPQLDPPFDDELPAAAAQHDGGGRHRRGDPWEVPHDAGSGTEGAAPGTEPARDPAGAPRPGIPPDEGTPSHQGTAPPSVTAPHRQGTAQPETAQPETAQHGHRAPGSGRGSAQAWATAHRFVDLCLEIFNGYRPVVQVRSASAPANTPEIVDEVLSAARRVARRHAAAAAPGQPLRARHSTARKVWRLKLRVSEPSPGVAEVVAVLADARGAWALAFRIEQRNGAWLCTALTALC